MFELVLVTCLGAGLCVEHPYWDLFPSYPACMAASQQLAAAFFMEHPQYKVAGVICRTPVAKKVPA
jgi:hypothetical protein